MKSFGNMNLEGSQRLGKSPQNLGRMKSELEIKLQGIVKREIPSSIIQNLAHLIELDFSVMKKLVALPNVGYVEKDKGKWIKDEKRVT